MCIRDSYYTLRSGLTYSRVKRLRNELMPEILALAAQLDTGVAFCQLDGRVYLVRNMVDLRRGSYAVLVLELAEDLFSAMRSIVWNQDVTIWLGDTAVPLVGEVQDAGLAAGAQGYRQEGETALLTGTRTGSDLCLLYTSRCV